MTTFRLDNAPDCVGEGSRFTRSLLNKTRQIQLVATNTCGRSETIRAIRRSMIRTRWSYFSCSRWRTRSLACVQPRRSRNVKLSLRVRFLSQDRSEIFPRLAVFTFFLVALLESFSLARSCGFLPHFSPVTSVHRLSRLTVCPDSAAGRLLIKF